ncbi:MAG: DUF4012 domain-containing protein [Microthrixaceae bacterium]|nr:DUF4012 domain-containing protein [Microthrixaceae bacterium]
MAFLVRHRKALLAVGLGLVAWIGACAWMIRGAGQALEAGRDELDAARRGATPASLLDPATDERLARARSHFDDAAGRLGNPVLLPVRIVPVVGRHLRSAERVVDGTDQATAVAQDGIARLAELTRQPVGMGTERLAALDELAELMVDTRQSMAAVDPGSPNALIDPLAEAVTELTDERDDTVATLDRAEDATRALRQILTGPEPYLLLGANNGEMRAGSGMFLSAAVIRFHDGSLQLGDVRPTQELVLASGSVPVSDDLRANWPWLDPGRDFRNLGLTADFPQSAEPAVSMWEKVPGGEPVAGVIVVDVDAIRAMLGVVGPVEVEGVTYSVDTVRGELLREQYGRFGSGRDERDQRRDALGTVARAVFERIEAGGWELDDMATAMTNAVQGRHLMVWSKASEHREAWAGVGADGHLTDRTVSVGLVNRGANKLDSQVETTLEIESERASDGRQMITMTYRIVNGAPTDGPAYVVGPNIEGMVAGQYRGIAVVNVPVGSTDVSIEGVRPTLSGMDGPTVVVGGEVVLASGESATVVVKARLPRGVDAVTLEPSARIPRTNLSLGGREPSVDRRRSIDLTRPLGDGVGTERGE